MHRLWVNSLSDSKRQKQQTILGSRKARLRPPNFFPSKMKNQEEKGNRRGILVILLKIQEK